MPPDLPSTDPLAALPDDELGALLRRAAALPDAPAAWQQRAIAAFQPATQGTAALSGVVSAAAGLAAAVIRHATQRLTARLSFDSWAVSPLASGLRSVGTTATRQLVFSAEGRDVDLRITPQGANFALDGQLLGPDESAAVVLTPLQTGAVRETAVDSMGEFHLGDVPSGRYQLVLQLGSLAIELPDIEVISAPPSGRGVTG